MAATRETVGMAACLVCAEGIPVKKSGQGALSFSCPWCDVSAYVRVGTQAYRMLAERVKVSKVEAAPVETKSPDTGKKSAEKVEGVAPVAAKKMPWED